MPKYAKTENMWMAMEPPVMLFQGKLTNMEGTLE